MNSILAIKYCKDVIRMLDDKGKKYREQVEPNKETLIQKKWLWLKNKSRKLKEAKI